ncbi:Unknown pentose isomerase [Rubellimicrobium mesophilum DSM 19309]|uniref:Fucose isomerase n=1 Tax=Rubellimicrobium mesophilum DSM 19309 TaxID=442562 RepID=A0A017HUP7_9RHOB|nr:hypothetical protein [Rubellimicrobium mesophilum]EYD78232.1 Unknown pentose isomerase [Rubellimicrobium mesophilum DSM 19309]
MTLTIMGENVTTQEAGSVPVTPQIRREVTLGVVIGSRAFFNGAPCRQAREEVLGQLQALGVRALILPFDATHNGAVQSISDAQLYADFFKQHRDVIDGLVICLPNFGDEIAVVELVNRAKLNVPILLQASNDENDKVSVKERRDAFCGKISVSNNFWQYGIPFSETTFHTVDAGGPSSPPTSTASPASVAPCAASATPAWGPSAPAPARSRRCATARSSCRTPASPSSPWTSPR